MKQTISISLLLAAALVWSGRAQEEGQLTRQGAYWVRTVRGAINRSPLQKLRVDTVGNVVLQGGSNGTAAYTLTARVKARDERDAQDRLRQFEVKSGTEGDQAYVIVRHGPLNEADLELSVSVPRDLRQVRVGTQMGSIRASDLDGSLEARSGGGAIALDSLRGPADVRTGGGDIQVGTVGGVLRCFSGAGTIRVANVGGESWLETAGGEIVVQQARAPVHTSSAGGNIRIDRAASAVFASTSGGLIQVNQAGGAVSAESSGGAIQVNRANGVQCDSAGGAIQLRSVSGALHASTNAGSILAELQAGQPMQDSMLSTRAGDITVFIPSNFPITVMARNASAGTLGRIVSDFPEIRLRTASQAGSVPVVAEGALDGGGPVLRINVIGGTIYLRKK